MKSVEPISIVTEFSDERRFRAEGDRAGLPDAGPASPSLSSVGRRGPFVDRRRPRPVRGALPGTRPAVHLWRPLPRRRQVRRPPGRVRRRRPAAQRLVRRHQRRHRRRRWPFPVPGAGLRIGRCGPGHAHRADRSGRHVVLPLVPLLPGARPLASRTLGEVADDCISNNESFDFIFPSFVLFC